MPTRMPWVATQQTKYRQPRPPQDAKTLNCREGINRAGGMETALVPKPGTEKKAVTTNERDQEDAESTVHCCQCLANDFHRSFPSALTAADRAMTMKSAAGKRLRFTRKLSRTNRLIRLRPVALLILRLEIAKPNRA